MTRAGAVLWALIGALAGCRPSAPTSSSELPLRVGSKSFTESVVLGELATLLARSSGTHAVHRASLGGTRLVWDALLGGQIDLYPEYTGTLEQEILRGEAPADLAAALASRGVGMLGPLGFNNTYAMGMREDVAAKLGITKISDLAAFPGLRFGFSNEFMNRGDGWPAVRASYGLPQTAVKGVDHDVAYRGLLAGALEVTDLYATDAEIPRHRLRVLRDDRGFFPRYDAVLVYRLDAAIRAPAAFAALRGLVGRISEAAMADMNAQVKIGRTSEPAVAAQFLQNQLGVGAQIVTGGRARAIADRAAEHLGLVAVSLLAAILLAVPLGVLAAKWRRLGQVVLAAVGVVQTIPSLALLVFMVPLLGIGAVPATVALFLYSLLPIVRNTHAGLKGISPQLRESAEALGLAPGAILRLIELPLASPSILAGIKSAAVINVGTATLGALVGAGGFGQPILTGVRLDDAGLILEGAVPASLLALAVQAGFELLERRVVPRGLRLQREG
jgi:osmoprotectant transport system permease protein